MMRGVAAVAGVVLLGGPLLVSPLPGVAVGGLAGALLVAVAMASGWRWAALLAGHVFVVDYAAAVWVAAGPVNLLGGLGYGIALLVLLEALDLARRLRQATVGDQVVRAHLFAWASLGMGALAVAVIAASAAGGLAPVIPVAVAPLLAAGGALGLVVLLAAAMVGARRSRGGGSALAGTRVDGTAYPGVQR